ncbi:TIGR01212 family radical SAM protein [Deferrisoma palaeochoriense]
MPSRPWPPDPYPGAGRYWKARFGGEVRRVSLDAGLSCPNRDGTVGTGGCLFCDPASFAPSAGDPRPVAEQLAAGIERLRARGVTRVAAYFQPHTNTHAPLPVLKALWDACRAFPEVVALCVGTRPDCVSDPVLDLLAGYRDRWEIWLELGLQSARDETLRRLGRGHTAEAFADAVRRARARGLLACAHVILGLPGEAPDDEAQTASFLADLGVEGVKLHQLAVVEGTPLAALWRRGEVAPLPEEAYIERAAAFVRRLPPRTVLHRLVGDTLGDRLLAPRYDRNRVIREIRARLRTGP